jgi:RNA-splicing ligase RtcB
MITGKTLIDLGYKPSKWFKDVIDYANSNNLDNNAIHRYIDSIVPKILEPHSEPISFYKNIVANNKQEQSNIDSVCAAMNSILTIPTAVNAAIMPDACPTGKGEIPVGGIVATKNAIHPSMHSADICCSVMATDLGYTDPKSVLDAAFETTHFGIGGRDRDNQLVRLPSDLKEKIMSNYYLNSNKSLNYAHSHLGTQGDGNHFLFVGKSKSNGHTYLVTHHGSRGFGANLYKEGMYKAQMFRQEIAPNVDPKNAWIPYDTKEGNDYWEALQIVREWTKLNHECLHDRVGEKTSDAHYERFWNEHNFVFKRDDIFYHAKGATPMTNDFVPDSTSGLRLVPLNMSEPILVMKESPNLTGLGFAPHGAGREYSRTEHCRIIKLQHKSGYQLFEEETQGLDVRFFSGKIDISELPSAYKNADKIKEQIRHFNLGTIVDEIEPYGCIMSGHADKPWRKKKC